MKPSNDIRDFLTTRRARITPEQAGLQVFGANRRVTGLRREEVALLAGISVEYYVRLERGNASGVSESVMEGLARALQLDEAERAHLAHLVRAAAPPRTPRRRPTSTRVRPVVQRILDSMVLAPAYLRNGRLDVLACNQLGAALYSPVFESASAGSPPNTARFLFLDPHASDFFVDWNKAADDVVAVLRAEAGKDPYDRNLADLIGELSLRSEEFRVRWAAHDVRFHRTGIKRLQHPLVGELTLEYEAFELAGDAGQRINIYSAQPGSPAAEALNLLASWTAAAPAGARTGVEAATERHG
ncbi:MAG: helix-turn-helix domain-containing protein [Micropruina sp.]|nr:helix-turn-helix domain-containing protein [Micropruina sp.]